MPKTILHVCEMSSHCKFDLLSLFFFPWPAEQNTFSHPVSCSRFLCSIFGRGEPAGVSEESVPKNAILSRSNIRTYHVLSCGLFLDSNCLLSRPFTFFLSSFCFDFPYALRAMVLTLLKNCAFKIMKLIMHFLSDMPKFWEQLMRAYPSIRTDTHRQLGTSRVKIVGAFVHVCVHHDIYTCIHVSCELFLHLFVHRSKPNEKQCAWLSQYDVRHYRQQYRPLLLTHGSSRTRPGIVARTFLHDIHVCCVCICMFLLSYKYINEWMC